MSDLIRVDPVVLRHYAAEIESVAGQLRAVGGGLAGSAQGAPSYDGQFGPRVSSIGLEASARARALADRLQELVATLRRKADEFEQADLASQAGLGALPPPPSVGTDLLDLTDQIPWRVWLVLGVVPFGDALGILEELVNLLSGRGISQLNLWLSIFGLAADAGWLDALVPDPVDGVNVGLAGIKAAVRSLGRLPPAAEKALLETLQAAVKDPDELGRVGKLLATLAQNGDVARRVIAEEDAFRAILQLKNGPEIIETFARGGDDALGRIGVGQAVRVSEVAPGRYDIPDPAHSVPPSSVHFGPDGAVDHPPLGDPAAFEEFLQNVYQAGPTTP